VLVWKDNSLQTAAVLKTTKEEREQPMYNLSVGWPNTFLAAGFLTHNKGGGSFGGSHSSSRGGGSSGGLTFLQFLLIFFFVIVSFIVLVAALGSITSKSKKKQVRKSGLCLSP
jgi:preprotein translocase subunit SecG